MNNEFFLDALVNEIKPAMGCTEPAMVALAGAKARELFAGETIELITVCASRDMIKNAMGVSIPGGNMKGITAAAALGVAIGNTKKGLNLLSEVDPEIVEKSLSLRTKLVLASEVPSLFVTVSIAGSNHNASVTISGQHDCFSKFEVDGNVLYDSCVNSALNDSSVSFENVTISDIVEFAEEVPMEKIAFIGEAIKNNFEISQYAMKHGFGLEVGRTMAQGLNEKPSSLNEAFLLASCYAAAGSDARMSGCSMPVYINSGSGNQGITVTVPVKVLSDFLGVSDEKMIRAVCISELLGLMLTEKKTRLSALCGAFTASIGTSCAYVYLLGGNLNTMENAVNTMVGDLTGIICDGAKKTCALKIYSCLEAAALSVRIAFNGQTPKADCGIVGDDSEESIFYLSRLCNEGMERTDQAIYSIMVDKANKVEF